MANFQIQLVIATSFSEHNSRLRECYCCCCSFSIFVNLAVHNKTNIPQSPLITRSPQARRHLRNNLSTSAQRPTPNGILPLRCVVGTNRRRFSIPIPSPGKEPPARRGGAAPQLHRVRPRIHANARNGMLASAQSATRGKKPDPGGY